MNPGNIDELIEQMQADELADAPLITPVNYAKMRPISPQLVFYAIRTKKIPVEVCNCGRRCIDIKKADNYYRNKKGRDVWPFGEDEEVDDGAE